MKEEDDGACRNNLEIGTHFVNTLSAFFHAGKLESFSKLLEVFTKLLMSWLLLRGFSRCPALYLIILVSASTEAARSFTYIERGFSSRLGAA